MTLNAAPDIRVRVAVGANAKACWVPPGTTVRTTLLEVAPNIDELLSQGWQLMHRRLGEQHSSPVSLYDRVEHDMTLIAVRRIGGRRELGIDETAEALNELIVMAAHIQDSLLTLSQFRTDINHLAAVIERLAADIATLRGESGQA